MGSPAWLAPSNPAFPQTDVQLCLVHHIRNVTKFVSWKGRKPLCAGMRPIYSAPTVEANARRRHNTSDMVERNGTESILPDCRDILLPHLRAPACATASPRLPTPLGRAIGRVSQEQPVMSVQIFSRVLIFPILRLVRLLHDLRSCRFGTQVVLVTSSTKSVNDWVPYPS